MLQSGSAVLASLFKITASFFPFDHPNTPLAPADPATHHTLPQQKGLNKSCHDKFSASVAEIRFALVKMKCPDETFTPFSVGSPGSPEIPHTSHQWISFGRGSKADFLYKPGTIIYFSEVFGQCWSNATESMWFYLVPTLCWWNKRRVKAQLRANCLLGKIFPCTRQSTSPIPFFLAVLESELQYLHQLIVP